METHVTEIAPRIYRLSTLVPDVAPPHGFTFNQFLVDAEEPLLFHCGHRGMFPAISAAVAKIMPLERLRWISFSHLEADESGAMNAWLAAAPRAEIAHGGLACDVSLNDLADRAPRKLEDNEMFDIGGRRLRFLATPHVPHGWDAGLMFEEATGTLLCSDLLGQIGNGPALRGQEIIEEALAAEDMFQSMSLTHNTVRTIRRLADLTPKTLAVMHGSSLSGDGRTALNAYADGLQTRILAAARA